MKRYKVDYIVDYSTGETRIIIRDSKSNAIIDNETINSILLEDDSTHEFHVICLELNAKYEDDLLYVEEINNYSLN